MQMRTHFQGLLCGRNSSPLSLVTEKKKSQFRSTKLLPPCVHCICKGKIWYSLLGQSGVAFRHKLCPLLRSASHRDSNGSNLVYVKILTHIPYRWWHSYFQRLVSPIPTYHHIMSIVPVFRSSSSVAEDSNTISDDDTNVVSTTFIELSDFLTSVCKWGIVYQLLKSSHPTSSVAFWRFPQPYWLRKAFIFASSLVTVHRKIVFATA